MEQLTYWLRWLVHRRMLQGQTHRTVRSVTVLPVRYDLMRRSTVRICTKEDITKLITGNVDEQREVNGQ